MTDETTWLYPTTNSTLLVSALKNASLSIESNFWIADATGLKADDGLVVRELYRQGRGLEPTLGSIGVWSPESGLQMTMRNKWARRADLTGVFLAASSASVRKVLESIFYSTSFTGCLSKSSSAYNPECLQKPSLQLSYSSNVNGMERL